MGLVVYLVIVLIMWSRGVELETSKQFSVMAIILNLYTNMTMLAYIGLTSLQLFAAVLRRISQVQQLDEHEIYAVKDEEEEFESKKN